MTVCAYLCILEPHLQQHFDYIQQNTRATENSLSNLKSMAAWKINHITVKLLFLRDNS